MPEGHEYLGEVLVRRGVVTAERLVPLFDAVKERGQALADLLVAANVTDEAHIAQALADECGVSFMPKIDPDSVPLALVSRLPITYAKQHKIIPIAEDEETLYVAVADPFDTEAIDDVRSVFGKRVEYAVAGGEAVVNALNRVWEKKEDGGAKLEGDQAHE